MPQTRLLAGNSKGMRAPSAYVSGRECIHQLFCSAIKQYSLQATLDKGKRVETLTCEAQDVTAWKWLAREPETKCAVRAVRVQKRLDAIPGTVHTRGMRGNTHNLLFLFTSAP